jgi:hypothetical protein
MTLHHLAVAKEVGKKLKIIMQINTWVQYAIARLSSSHKGATPVKTYHFVIGWLFPFM